MKKNILFLIYCCQTLTASPTGEKIIHGNIKVSRNGSNIHVNQTGKKGIIDWTSFSIEKGNCAVFDQENKDCAILNRVVGTTPSNIEGKISAIGKVYLLNENGILIGKDAYINTHSFIASALNITNQMFLQDHNLSFSTDKEQSVINRGKIECLGDIFLLAPIVKNEGELISSEGKISLIGSNTLIINKGDEHIAIQPKGYGKVVNRGYIKAIQTDLIAQGENPYSLGVNQEGIIDATGTCIKNGRVYLHAIKNKIAVSGTIKAQEKITVLGDEISIKDDSILNANGKEKGGEILIGGDFQGENSDVPHARYLEVEKGALITANATENGNGGKVILWADYKNEFQGKIECKGGKESGNGGFVEISCPRELKYRKGDVSTMAPNGNMGKLLLDPSDIAITSENFSSPPFPTTAPGTYDPTEGAATLNAEDIETALASNNVTISTSAGTGGNGTISFDEYTSISWATPTTLSLHADCNIILNSGVRITNTGTGFFTAMDFNANKSTPASTGSFTGISFNNSILSSIEGDIFLSATSGTEKYNIGINIGSASRILSTGTGINAAKITLQGEGGSTISYSNNASSSSYSRGVSITKSSNLNSVDGDIVIIGSASGPEYYNNGVNIEQNALIASTGSGLITINGNCTTGLDANIGLNIDSLAIIQSANGNILLTGSTSAAGSYNYGICIKDHSTVQSTGTATLQINGTSNGALINNFGILCSGGNVFSSLGDITLTGLSNGSGNYNSGTSLTNYATISSTGTGISSSKITITTDSGTGINYNHGMLLDVYSSLTSIDGDINITATSRGTGDFCNGINLNNESGISSTGVGANAANITLTTQGGAGNIQVEGVYGQDQSYVTSVDGILTVTGGMVIKK